MVDNVVLNEKVALGFKGGPTFSTGKLAMVNGQERRIQNRAIAQHVYSWNYSNSDLTVIAAVRAFWFDRRGDFKAWLLKDYADYQLVGEAIGVGAGIVTTFQIIKTYTAGSNPYTRTIRHIKSGTLAVYVGGVLQSATNSPPDYTVSATGLITFTSAPTGTITVDAEFYVPVRFDGDKLVATVDFNSTFNVRSIENLTAVEVIP
jgi:uncharacterized protein (TIGR02217 family)